MPSLKSDEPSHQDRWKAVLAAAFILILLALTWWWLHPSTGGPITLPIGSGNLTFIPPSATYLLSSPQENASLTLSSNRSFDSLIYSARIKNTGSTPFNDTALVTLFPNSYAPASLQFRQTPPELQSTFLFTSPVVRATPLNLVPGETATLSVSTRINFSSEASSPLFILGNFTSFNESQTLAPQENPLLLISSRLSASPLDENAAGILSAFLSESSLNNEDPKAYPLAVRAIASTQALPVESQAQALAGFRFLLLDPKAGDHPTAQERVGNALYYGTLISRANSIATAQGASQGGTISDALSQLLGGLYNTMTGEGEPMWKRLAAMDQMLSEKEKQLGISQSASSSGGPSPSPGNQQTSSNSLFPSLPTSITIVVSETLPQNSSTLTLHTSVDLGYPLARFEGDAAPLLTFTPRKVGTSTEAQIAVDVSRQQLQSGVLPFDEIDGTMVLGYFSLEAQQARVPVRILIAPHTNLETLANQQSIDFGDSDPTVGEALAAIAQSVSCNPLASLSPDSFKGITPAGAIFCPVPPSQRITSPFEPRHVAGCSACSTFHKGIDIAIPSGTPIYSPADGVVAVEFHDSTCGWGIKIDHGTDSNGKSLASGYCHLLQFVARKGSAVTRGQLVAYSGGRAGAPGSGDSTGAHLHFMIYLNGEKIDPFPYYQSCTQSLPASAGPTPSPGPTATALAGSPPSPSATDWTDGLDANGCTTNAFFGSIASGIPPAGFTAAGPLHQNIVYTEFGCGSDAQGMASGLGSTDSRHPLYAALPHYAAIPAVCRQSVRSSGGSSIAGCYWIEVTNPASGATLAVPVLDVGPWNTRDSYPWTSARPQAESGTDLTGRRTNRAGLDLSCTTEKMLGLPQGKGIAAWRFIQPASG